MHSRLVRLAGLAEKLIGTAVAFALVAAAAPGHARADEMPGAPAAAAVRPGPTAAEFAKLQAEVREQRQLIIQMLQSEQQRYDMILRLVQGQGGAAAAAAAAGELAEAPAAAPVPAAAPPSSGGGGSSRSSSSEAVRRTATVEGKVSVPGGVVGDVYVYVDNVRGAPARGRSLEIRQENKQFFPRVAVVQLGTTVTFPNRDAVYHNVFSSSAGNSFDLGSYRAGDKARSVTLTHPGVVDVFCNMHQKMSASVLVVPGPLYTKVKADGTFRLDGVPVGTRKLVAWSPRVRGAQQRVDVTAGGTAVTFALQPEESKAHANKLGQPYGSYRD